MVVIDRAILTIVLTADNALQIQYAIERGSPTYLVQSAKISELVATCANLTERLS
ncbi:hypothetical protein [Chamaesiphon sp. OTE_8_metabat_110]|uniref:hypothetical protein n=1 Tax=Chamaesiphon sp. OTE_8_metabat_110 TaxID=2964696 RepID=UPI00286A1AA7|nr:hypothetical protein [Chamaesiphon sp. OTE_8_metabat_110]